MQESHIAFIAGERVVVRDEHWTVLQTDVFESACLVKLRGIGDHNRDELQCVITPFDRVDRTASARRIRQRSRRAVLATVANAVAASVPWDQCWTAANARIDLRAWQLEPAIAAVTGATRILLADAVGLGKTIQAGLIVSELCARGLVDRVLVLTPASIREQWAGELHTRFGLSPVVFDQAALATASASLPPDVNPWATAGLIVSSIDLVKRPEVRAALEAIPFDVLIVDEAHHATPGSDRGAVVADLAARTPWVVLSTATPHSGDDRAFEFLRGLGDVGSTAIRVFRRSGQIVSGAFPRRSRVFEVAPTPDERALLDATRDYARSLAATGHEPGPRLVASVIARRAASSAQAAARTLERRLALLNRESPAERQALLPWEEVETVDDDVSDAVLSSPGLGDVAREAEWLKRLIELARAASDSASKLTILRRLLRRTREQLLVFSEYRDVALLVASALADLTSVAALHGGLSPRERRVAVHAFNSGAVRTLVATDAAGEGLNLHERCRLVVNIELPWTPLRLEQRIGRVDRIGQTRRVHALHLVHRGSYEGTVIARLERRRARASARDHPSGATFQGSRTAMERRLAQLGSQHVSRHCAGAVYSARHSATRPSFPVMLLYAIPLLDGAGRLVQRDVVAVRLIGHSTARVLSRQRLRDLGNDPHVRRVVAEAAASQALMTLRVTASAAEALETRMQSLLAELERRRQTAVWQGSLFDRRNEQRAQQRAANLAMLTSHLQRRRDQARALRQIVTADPELVAAWLDEL